VLGPPRPRAARRIVGIPSSIIPAGVSTYPSSSPSSSAGTQHGDRLQEAQLTTTNGPL